MKALLARDHHVLDTERCAIFCTCADCSAAISGTIGTSPPGHWQWPGRGFMS